MHALAARSQELFWDRETYLPLRCEQKTYIIHIAVQYILYRYDMSHSYYIVFRKAQSYIHMTSHIAITYLI